jgi:hypothetical protein
LGFHNLDKCYFCRTVITFDYVCMITVIRSSSLEFTSDQSVVISLRALFLEQRERHVSCDAHKQHMIIVETTTSSLCVLSGGECLQYHHVK